MLSNDSYCFGSGGDLNYKNITIQKWGRKMNVAIKNIFVI